LDICNEEYQKRNVTNAELKALYSVAMPYGVHWPQPLGKAVSMVTGEKRNQAWLTEN
jgi:hypothetical protein